LLSVDCAPAQQAPPATLDELLTRAIQTNRNLLAARQQVEEARGLLRQAAVRPAPTLEIGGASGRPLATIGEEQFSAGISREFETAGKRARRQEVAAKRLAVVQADYDERVRQLRYEIGQRYADYLASEEKLRILNELIEANRRSMDLIRARVEKGDAAALEQNLVAVEIGRAAAQSASAIGQLESARADVSRLIGLESGEDWSAAAPSVPQHTVLLAELQKRGIERRPDLRSLVLLEEEGAAATALAEAEGKPNITASAGYSRVKSRLDDQFGTNLNGELTPLRDRDDILAVAISLPLFTRRRNAGNIEASVARTRAAQLRKEYLARAIPLEIDAAWRRFQNSRSALDALETAAIAPAQRNLEVIRQAYQLGQMRLLDVLVEQRRVLDMQLSSIDIRQELYKSLFELERAVGGPVQ
jgi:cobalt-zinc-cadmium efflux system outer membrane protein